jgi:hypothetical protein
MAGPGAGLSENSLDLLLCGIRQNLLKLLNDAGIRLLGSALVNLVGKLLSEELLGR